MNGAVFALVAVLAVLAVLAWRQLRAEGHLYGLDRWVRRMAAILWAGVASRRDDRGRVTRRGNDNE